MSERVVLRGASSGGGVFDARGNLIGITTLVVVGKEHLNQSLNFAISAEMFWAPYGAVTAPLIVAT